MRFILDVAPVSASSNPRHHLGSNARAVYQRTLDHMGLMVRDQRNRNGWPTLTGKVQVCIDTFVADERGVDCDAVVKCVLDSAQRGGAVANDRQVALLVARRIVGEGRPRIELQVEAHGAP